MANERFSYQVLEFKPGFWGGVKTREVNDELNRLGTQGWELAGVLPPGGVSGVRLILKRAQ